MDLMLAATWRMAVSLPGALAVAVGSVAEVVAGCLVAAGARHLRCHQKKSHLGRHRLRSLRWLFIDTTTLPSAVNAYMNYTKHVNAGLAGEAWRLQTRHRDRNERVNGNLEALEGRGSQNNAHA